jgi:cobalt-zinc-cadmium efflux system outer membrane protein
MRLPHHASILLAVCTITANAQQWTEDAIIAKFLEQNPMEREYRARIALSGSEYRGRTQYANPSISVTREGAGRTEFYQASQALPLNGRIPLLRQAGVAHEQALTAEGEFSLWQARCSLRSAFYRLLSSQLRSDVFANSLKQLDGAIQKLKAREQEGESSKLDRMRTEQERSELVAQWSTVRASQELDRGEILAFLPASTQLETVAGEINRPLSMPGIEELTQLALSGRGDFSGERHRIEQFRMEQRAAERLRIPEPTLIAGLKRAEINAPGIASGPVLGVSLSIPLFNQGKSEVARYSAEQERTNARLEMMSRKLKAAIVAASRAYTIRRQALDNYAQDGVTGGNQLLQIATLAYDEGEVGILQLLDAYRVRHQSSLRQIELQLEARQALIHLESLIGQELSK